MSNVNIKEVNGGQKTTFSTLDAIELDNGTTSTYILVTDIMKFPAGTMINGKIVPTVVSNDLVLTLQTAAGSTPSASDPVLININGTWRAVTAATTCTLADGTNWFSAGSDTLKTIEIDYFAYVVWDSNSSIVAISFSRIPYGTLVSDFSSTTTNEKYLANYANFTSTDDVVNIGRFAATLSAGAGYTWTVPTFTSSNLINRPIDETRELSFTQVWTNLTVGSATLYAKYSIKGRYVLARMGIVLSGTTVGSAPNIALPITPSTLGTTFEHFGDVVIRDTGTGVYNGTAYLISGLLYPQALAASGSYTSPTNLSSTIPMTWANTDEMEITCRYIC